MVEKQSSTLILCGNVAINSKPGIFCNAGLLHFEERLVLNRKTDTRHSGKCRASGAHSPQHGQTSGTKTVIVAVYLLLSYPSPVSSVS